MYSVSGDGGAFSKYFVFVFNVKLEMEPKHLLVSDMEERIVRREPMQQCKSVVQADEFSVRSLRAFNLSLKLIFSSSFNHSIMHDRNSEPPPFRNNYMTKR